MAPFNHFDFLAPYYDHFIRPGGVAGLSTRVNLPTMGVLLDVGGGTGQKSMQLMKLVGGIIVVDSSKGMLSRARQKDGIIPVRSESEQLPFKDGTIDRVIMVDALHHVKDYETTIREMWRVTRPGGRIVIEEPDIRSLSGKVMALIEKIALMRSRFISPQGIAGCFDYPNAAVTIQVEEATAWIIVDKHPE